MKKILLLSTIIALSFSSCKDDDETPISKGYVTDGLPLPQQKNALLMMGTSLSNPANGVFESTRLIAEDEYKGRVNTMNMLNDNATKFYEPYADSIMMNFQSPSSPYFVVDGEEIPDENLEYLLDAYRVATKRKPVLAVAHKVTQNDTAWVVNHKVQFFQDSIYDEFYIDTYMLATLKAELYNIGELTEIDLRVQSMKDLIANPPVPFESQWDIDIPNLDSSKVLAKEGSPFYHQNLFIAKYDSTSTWGPKLGSYWPFGGEFYAGDVIGTKDTPIIQYIPKDRNMSDFFESYNIKFMSVVWVRNQFTGTMEHANSYTSDATFTVKAEK